MMEKHLFAMSYIKIQTTGIVVDLLLVDGTILPQGARPPELRIEGLFDTVFLRFFKHGGEYLDIEFDNLCPTKELTGKASIEISPPLKYSEYFNLLICDSGYDSTRVASPDHVRGFLEVKEE